MKNLITITAVASPKRVESAKVRIDGAHLCKVPISESSRHGEAANAEILSRGMDRINRLCF